MIRNTALCDDAIFSDAGKCLRFLQHSDHGRGFRFTVNHGASLGEFTGGG